VLDDQPALAYGQPPSRGDAASLRVAEHLRQQILAGAIHPGERIRQEEVANRIDVPPIRASSPCTEVRSQPTPGFGAGSMRSSQADVATLICRP
jgi:Bacterial regulatory proteins, gntR family